MDACACCNHPCSDLRLTGCGCLLHTRCIPLSLVLNHRHAAVAASAPTTSTATTTANGQHTWMLTANTTDTVYCRFCNSHVPAGIAILPLSFDDLERSVALRVESMKTGAPVSSGSSICSKNSVASAVSGGDDARGTADAATATTTSNTKKRDREDSFSDDGLATAATATAGGVETDGSYSRSSYIVYSQGRKTFNNSLVSDEDLFRTGRWNDEEVEYVDQLVSLFDQGLLPVTNGTKLATFLGDLLLSKASRLTKKMKNAKLSSRAFSMSPAATMDASPNMTLQEQMLRDITARRELSALQEHFVMTLPSKSAQIEMRFNMAKQWRSYFSTLCIEVEYPHLDVNGWIASLEELEARASDAEAQLRSVRRRKMGLSSTRSPQLSFTVSTGASSSVPRPVSIQSFATTNSASTSALQQLVDGNNASTTNRSGVGEVADDFDRDMMFLMGEEITDFGTAPAVSAPPPVLSELRDWACCSNPFLEAVSVYLQERNLPFQYVDIWVPSLSDGQPFVGDGQLDKHEEVVSLLPAGFSIREDQDETISSAMTAFGEYSKAFSFKPGVGLPGRVYISGKTAWQKSLSDVHESVFARVAGAKMYGLKTAAAIPISAAGVGRMILVLYSTQELPLDWSMLEQCSNDLAGYSPQPKWKLVIEVGPQGGETQNGDFKAFDSMVTGDGTAPAMSRHDVTPSHIIEPMSDDALEKRLISLLGDQMSGFQNISSGESTSSTDSDVRDFLPDMMRIRLLMLCPQEKRSQEDNDCLDVLMSSFKNYIEESTRPDKEIATLLAREWQCLKMFSEDRSPPLAPTLPMGSNYFVTANQMLAASFLPEKQKGHSPLQSPLNEAGGKALVQPFFMDRRQHSLSQGDNSLMVYDHTPINNQRDTMKGSDGRMLGAMAPKLANLYNTAML